MNKKYKHNKKQELIKILNNVKTTNSYLILNIIKKEQLNHLIDKLDCIKIKVKITTITKKNYISSNEQFLSLLNIFINSFQEDFYFLKNNFEYIIETLLQNDKNTRFLLSKKYYGCNKNISNFNIKAKKLITNGYYNNLKYLSPKSTLITKFIKENNINIKKKNLSKKEIENIYNTLIKLSICNAKELNNFQLFEDINHYIKETNKYNKINNQIIKSIENNYINNWSLMINNYYVKKDIIKIFIN